MITETSNLLNYSAENLSLLIQCIDEKIEAQKALTAFTNMLIESEHVAERFEIELRTQIAKRNNRLDDLYGLRVAIMNAHQIVQKRERVTSN
jgi:hypothetical protein